MASVSNRYRKTLAVITSMLGLVTVLGPLGGVAKANHPTTACLDVTPESETNPTYAPNNTHTVTATMKSPDPDPPFLTCTGSNQNAGSGGGTGSVKISFEIDGVNDPQNDGDTPATPDKFCIIPQGQSSCSMTYTGTETGEDEIRGWIDHDGTDTMEGDDAEGPDETNPQQMGEKPEPDDTDVVEKTWETELECLPETDINDADSGHTITCTASDGTNPAANVNVDAEATGANDPDNSNSPGSPDFTCTTNANGQCSFTHGPGGTGTTNSVGVTTYRAWIDGDNNDGTTEADATEGRDESTTAGATAESDETDVVQKTWTARLDCEPDTDTNPVGTAHTVTCTARDAQDDPVQGAPVDVEATGTNDPDNANSPTSPDFTCVTGQDGSCTFTHGPGGTGTSTSQGTTTYRAWVDADNNNTTTEADTAEGRDETVTPGSKPEPDDTDVTDKAWTFEPLTLDCDDSGGPDTERELNRGEGGPSSNETYTCQVRDAAGNLLTSQDTQVKGEVENGVNDPTDNPEGASYNTPDYTCQTTTTGQCTITVTQADGEQGTAEICFWIGTAQEGATLCGDEPTGENQNQNGSDTGNDKADQVEKTWEVRNADGVDAEPETDRNNLGENHTITAHTYDQFGDDFNSATTVKFEFFTGSPTDTDGNTPESPDRTCTTSGGNNNCTMTYTQATTPGVDLICVWTNTDPDMQGNNATGTCDGEGRTDADDDPANPDVPENPRKDDVDVVEKIWDVSRLDCTPEQDRNPTGTSHTVECTAKDRNDVNRANTRVDVEATGANDPDNGNSPGTPDFTCTTGVDGTCTFTHSTPTNDTGTTTYRAWIDLDGQDSTTEADAAEGRDESATVGDDAEADDTDVVEKTWGASRLDCTPEQKINPTGTTHTVTCTARSQGDATVEGVHVDAEATGANDPDNGNSPDSPDFHCTTGNDGSCSFDHGPADDTGTTTYRAWIDFDNDHSTNESDASEARDEDATAGDDQDPDDTDVVEKTWGASRLDCGPEEASSATGTTHTVNCTARSHGNDTNEGTAIDVEATGANDPDGTNSPGSPDFSCTTGNDGSCSFDHGPGAAAGTTTYRAWIDLDGDNSTSEDDGTEGRNEDNDAGGDGEPDDTDVVEQTWTANRNRSISLESSKSSVESGRKVRFFGQITGHPSCEAGQEVRLQASKSRRSSTYSTVATVASDPSGKFEFRVSVSRSRRYRALTPETPACDRARSNFVAVLAR